MAELQSRFLYRVLGGYTYSLFIVNVLAIQINTLVNRLDVQSSRSRTILHGYQLCIGQALTFVSQHSRQYIISSLVFVSQSYRDGEIFVVIFSWKISGIVDSSYMSLKIFHPNTNICCGIWKRAVNDQNIIEISEHSGKTDFLLAQNSGNDFFHLV